MVAFVGLEIWSAVSQSFQMRATNAYISTYCRVPDE